MKTLSTIVNKIKSAKKIAILSHIFPDGDAIGSSLALYIALKKLNKTVDIYNQDGVPNIYAFLPGASKILTEWNNNLIYDLAIVLDTGDLERIGKCIEVFNSSLQKINIDHHITNSNFGEINYIETEASAVGEIVYRIINLLNVKLDKDIAECLYTALATDTGGFRYSNTTSTCMRLAADLIGYGIDIADICRKIFDLTSETKVRLIGAVLNTLETFSNGKIAVIYITSEQMEKLKAKLEDCEGIVNFARNIIGVEAAAFLVELPQNRIKVNLRSNNYIDVSEIAQKFSGGGHKKAAGCILTEIPLTEAKELIVKELTRSLHQYLP